MYWDELIRASEKRERLRFEVVCPREDKTNAAAGEVGLVLATDGLEIPSGKLFIQ